MHLNQGGSMSLLTIEEQEAGRPGGASALLALGFRAF
jgi:hypothetical protein